MKTTWDKQKKKKVRGKFPKKSTVWRNFSRYIRTRDCVATTGTLNLCVCVTCGQTYPFKEIQAGHAIQGRKNAILFDEQLVNGQCQICNGYMGGAYDKYSVWFIKVYGFDLWEQKVESNVAGVQFKGWQLKELNDLYKKKYADLIKGYNKRILV